MAIQSLTKARLNISLKSSSEVILDSPINHLFKSLEDITHQLRTTLNLLLITVAFDKTLETEKNILILMWKISS